MDPERGNKLGTDSPSSRETSQSSTSFPSSSRSATEAVWALEGVLSPGQDESIRQRRIRSCSQRAENASEPRPRSQSTGRRSGSEATAGVSKRDSRDGSYELEYVDVPEARLSETTSIAVDGDDVWFVGDSSTRLWLIDSEAGSIVNSFPDRGKPQRGGRRRGRGRVGRQPFGHLALAPGYPKTESIPRDDPARRDLGRPRRQVRQDLDEPRGCRRGSPDPFRISSGCSTIGGWAAGSGSRY